MYTVGIDIGSAFAKGALLADQTLCESVVMPSGGDYRTTAKTIWEKIVANAGLSPEMVIRTIATGYGSQMADCADGVKTDLICHSRGVVFACPSVRTAVDVGDCASRAFRIDARGRLVKFLLSGKCAGGSGRVLRVIAKVLRIELEALAGLSLAARGRVDFSTSCAVFAESEAVSRLAEGVGAEELLAGMHRALAAQVNGLLQRLEIEDDFALVGGGAQDAALVAAMEEMIGRTVTVPPQPQLTAALGAAIIAQESATKH